MSSSIATATPSVRDLTPLNKNISYRVSCSPLHPLKEHNSNIPDLARVGIRARKSTV
jgi:hypothetical protein